MAAPSVRRAGGPLRTGRSLSRGRRRAETYEGQTRRRDAPATRRSEPVRSPGGGRPAPRGRAVRRAATTMTSRRPCREVRRATPGARDSLMTASSTAVTWASCTAARADRDAGSTRRTETRRARPPAAARRAPPPRARHRTCHRHKASQAGCEPHLRPARCRDAPPCRATTASRRRRRRGRVPLGERRAERR